MVHWESRNELNTFRLLDCDPRVWRFLEQPCRVVFTLDGTRRSHCPDLLVIGADGQQLWEIKSRSDSTDTEVVRRTELLQQALPDYGFTYRLVVAEELASGFRLQNSNLLLQFGKREVGVQDWEQVRRVIEAEGSVVWERICRGDYGRRGREAVCSLVLRGVLRMDMDSVLTPETRFYSRKEGR